MRMRWHCRNGLENLPGKLILFCVAAAIASSAQTLTILARFSGSNGVYPGALVQAADGNFYGTSYFGGNLAGNCAGSGCGTFFKLAPTGNLTTIYSFCAQQYCIDGMWPSSLVQAHDGNFYGTTSGGGTWSYGTVFRITPDGTLTTLYNFGQQNGQVDGAGPSGGVILASDGNFYGVTAGGGLYEQGTVFRMTPSGTLTTIHTFCSQPNCTDGILPIGGLVQASDGNLYGTTQAGGELYGTVFKVTLSGTLTTLHDFNGADGSLANAALVQGTDGNFYGTTNEGGNDDAGTVFKMTPSGAFTVLHSFVFGAPDDGSYPSAALVQATDGNFYGSSFEGGAYGWGTLFQITPAGVLTLLHSFDLTDDGSWPEAAMVQGTDGNLYGTNSAPENCGDLCGTIFRLTKPTMVPAEFIPVTPCRVVDTRSPYGEFGGPLIIGGSSRSFPIPQGACNIPATAATYSLNVTAVPHGPLGYLTIWAAGQSQPLVSTMNS